MKTLEKVKLAYRNNWECDSYHISSNGIGPIITSLKEVEIDGKTYDVEEREMSVDYDDMGRTYSATSTHFFVITKVFGMKMKLDLRDIVPKIDVYATKYSTRSKKKESVNDTWRNMI